MPRTTRVLTILVLLAASVGALPAAALLDAHAAGRAETSLTAAHEEGRCGGHDHTACTWLATARAVPTPSCHALSELGDSALAATVEGERRPAFRSVLRIHPRAPPSV